MKFRSLLAMLFALTLIAAACGDDTSSPTVTGDAPEESGADEAMEDDAMAEEEHDDSMEEDDAMADEDAMEEDDAMADEDAMEDDDAMADVPMAIVSLSPSATEMLFAVGAGDQVVAVDAFSNFPEGAPVTDLSGWEPNIEAISAFEPDLVVSSGPIEGLDAIGVENLVLPAAVDFNDVYSQIEQVGAATGHIAEAAELVANMQADIEATLAALPERDAPLSFFHEIDATYYSSTSSTFIGQVYTLFGLENIADIADPDGEAFGFPQLTEEFILTEDPDIIFLADTVYGGVTAETASARPGWDQLSAVQNGNVIELNDDIVGRWGPRIVEAVQAIGEAVANVEAVPAG
jgi:iron complex transport system substrate-binding protein